MGVNGTLSEEIMDLGDIFGGDQSLEGGGGQREGFTIRKFPKRDQSFIQ